MRTMAKEKRPYILSDAMDIRKEYDKSNIVKKAVIRAKAVIPNKDQPEYAQAMVLQKQINRGKRNFDKREAERQREKRKAEREEARALARENAKRMRFHFFKEQKYYFYNLNPVTSKILRWLKRNIFDKISLLFRKHHTAMINPEEERKENVPFAKSVPQFQKEPEKEFISMDKANYKQTRLDAVQDIVEEFRMFEEEVNMHPLEDVPREDILKFIPSFLMDERTIDESVLTNAFAFIADLKMDDVEYNAEDNRFTFHIDDKIVYMTDDGQLSYPENVQGDVDISKIKPISDFLRKNNGYVENLLAETKIDDKSLNMVREFVERANLKNEKGYLDVFEKAASNNSAIMYMQNLSMVRIDRFEGLSDREKFEYGFKIPKEIIPAMANPTDYVKIICRMQEYYQGGSSIEDAYNMASCFLIDTKEQTQPITVVEGETYDTVKNHMYYLMERGLSSSEISMLIQSYNHLKDETSMKVCVENIERQLDAHVPIVEIVQRASGIEYTPHKIAEEIDRTFKTEKMDNLINAYRKNAISPLNTYMSTLSYQEMEEVFKLLPDKTNEDLRYFISETGNQHRFIDVPEPEIEEDFSLDELGFSSEMDEEEILQNVDDREEGYDSFQL